MDYSNYKLSGKTYSGSEKKIGILINNERYIVKFQKDSETGLRYNHISEYLGSHIFQIIGLNTQETFLGTYKNENVVVMKDFLNDGEMFVPFNEVGESTLETDKEKHQYSYEDIMHMLKENTKLTDIEETIQLFWDMFIVDAFIGNFDRHGMNWGFIKKDNKYKMAPIFDNGSCLFPQMNNENEMREVIASQTEIDKRTFGFPTSQIKLNGKKSSYYEVISSLQFEECNNALKRIFPKIDLQKIDNVIKGLPISKIHKEFYKVMLESRYNKILKESYNKLKGE